MNLPIPAPLKTHWRIIAAFFAVILVGTGVAYYFIHAAAQGSEAALAQMKEELDSAKAALETSTQAAIKSKAAWDKEKALNAELKKTMATSDQELQNLRASLEHMTQAAAAAKESKAKAVKPTVQKVQVASSKTNCPKSEPGTNKEQMRALQDFQADLYRRESELRDEAKKLAEERSKLANDKRKLDLDKSEYRWPHNGETGNNKK